MPILVTPANTPASRRKAKWSVMENVTVLQFYVHQSHKQEVVINNYTNASLYQVINDSCLRSTLIYGVTVIRVPWSLRYIYKHQSLLAWYPSTIHLFLNLEDTRSPNEKHHRCAVKRMEKLGLAQGGSDTRGFCRYTNAVLNSSWFMPSTVWYVVITLNSLLLS